MEAPNGGYVRINQQRSTRGKADCRAVAGPLRIAIASSGLGHISRGVESWANDLATALNRAGHDVSLFQGAETHPDVWRHPMRCWKRFDRRTSLLNALTKRIGGWRYGCGSEYQIEQSTFSLSLWTAIRKDYDILHVQDYWVAVILDYLHRCGRSRPRVLFGNGTEESDSDLRRFRYLQHLTPHYRDGWKSKQPAGQLSFAVPIHVDTSQFLPGDRSEARAIWKLPADALIILCVSALRIAHKRCDYVVREFDSFRRSTSQPALLVMAGAREKETVDFIASAKAQLGDSIVVFESVERAKLPSLYQAADLFTIGSLHEMFGIVLVEALATGLPITCNRTPVFEWVAGPAAAPEDISQPGGLVRQWQRMLEPQFRRQCSTAGLAYANKTFSENVVVEQTLNMYAAMMADFPGLVT